ncbi:MAG TPA: hypothetical protein VFD70_16620, partial [Anaerolineae bacterium]|nr:hypothetical protein [Anaerolineae bacterium]
MRRLILSGSFLVLALAVGACAAPAATPAPPVVQTVVVPQTVVSQATVVVPQTVVSQQTVVAQQTVVVTPPPQPTTAPKFAGTTLKYIDNPDGETDAFLALV